KAKGISEWLDVTEIAFYLSIFGVLMNKYTQEEDIIFSAPFSHRHNMAVEATVGNFVFMLPRSLTIKEERCPQAISHHVFDGCIQAFKHAAYPNTLIVRHNDLMSMPDSPSVFDISFVYDAYEETSDAELDTDLFHATNVSFPGNLMVIFNRTDTGD